jgi:protein-tyrosine phosphatase
MARDIVPLVAHPERNKDIMRDPARLHELRHLGCLFQVTAGALAGRFGEVAEARAREIVAAGWATVLASDAHNAVARPPVLSEGLAVAAGLIGETEARRLVWDNPWQIAASQFGVAA